MTWAPLCSCGHEPHVGQHCRSAGCGHYQQAPHCEICSHGPHRPGRCLALGIARRCMCEPGMTKDSLDAATMERDRGQAPQWF